MKDLFNVEKKVILITGSSRGLGYAIARGFIEYGAKVVLNGRNNETLNAAIEGFKKGGYEVYGSIFDVTNKKSVEKSIADIETNIGPIDILINNAGIHRRSPLEEMSIEDWEVVINTNLTSAFIVSQCVAKNMINRKKGKIINITSLNAEGGRPTIGNYAAAKGGLKMLTKSMACEWGKYNIQINAIGPGYFKTELTKVLSQNQEFDQWVKSEVPLGRWGQPEELVGAAIFLASGASDYVNGHTLYVDGGWLASL